MKLTKYSIFEIVLRFSLLISILMVFGCATTLKGRYQDIPVNSDPTGAYVNVDGNVVGVTPTEIKLRRKYDHLVTVEKTGYRPMSVPVLKSVGGAVWGNILAGGLIGWGVDAATGAQYNLEPETIFVRLEAIMDEMGVASPERPSRSREGINKLNELDEMLENKLITEEEYVESRSNILRTYFSEMVPSDESN